MKTKLKRFTAIAAFVLMGFVFGCWVTSRYTNRMCSELFHSLAVSQGSLQTTRYVNFLQACRDGKADSAKERMEIWLDSEVIQLAGFSSRQKEPNEMAMNSLRKAAAYRAAHPHHSLQEAGVSEALRLVTKRPE